MKQTINKDHPRIKGRTPGEQNQRNSLSRDINGIRKLENVSSTTKDALIYDIRQKRSDSVEIKESLKEKILNMIIKIPSDPTMVDKVRKLNEREKILIQNELIDSYVESFNNVDLENFLSFGGNEHDGYMKSIELLSKIGFKANLPQKNQGDNFEDFDDKHKSYYKDTNLDGFLVDKDGDLACVYKGKSYYFYNGEYSGKDIINFDYPESKDGGKAYFFNSAVKDGLSCGEGVGCDKRAKNILYTTNNILKNNNIVYMFYSHRPYSVIVSTPFGNKLITETGSESYSPDLSSVFGIKKDELESLGNKAK